MKARFHQEQKKKHQGQHSIEVLFTEANIYIIGTSPQRKNGITPVGYSGQASLKQGSM
jgi:hypothetical protein